jgi:ABC-type antimicrobial peptide transport system permease subunit
VLITVIGGMGLMGLGLAIVGLYGLVAFAVGRRTREIGIRMAVGAVHVAVLRMVLRQGLVLALAGLAVGLAASVGAGELLQAAFPSGEDPQSSAFGFHAPLVRLPEMRLYGIFVSMRSRGYGRVWFPDTVFLGRLMSGVTTLRVIDRRRYVRRTSTRV